LQEAMFYEKLPNAQIHCRLCPHNCIILPKCTGFCGVRENREGTLFSLNYGRVSSLALDPVEKKPLRKFFPGSYLLSVGSVGCNLRCPFCQNYTIARVQLEDTETIFLKSEALVAKAVALKAQGNIGIAYTYNEPTVWYEYVYETAQLARSAGLCNVLVTNGYINREPLMQLLPYIDAMNIDLKAYQEDFYRHIVKGGLEEVKATITLAAKHCHVEVTTLIIPGLNDSVDDITALAQWLAGLSPDVPLHLSRFFPNYEMTDRPATPVETLRALGEVAKGFLNNVYLGNI